MSCCNREKKRKETREYPEGVDPCCHVSGRRCMCLPYDDPWMITAQTLSIVCIFVSWIWWPVFYIGLAGMTMMQVAWCCRQNRGVLFMSAAVAMICALASIGAGIYILIVFSRNTRCSAWDLDAYSNNYDYTWAQSSLSKDYCNEAKWAIIAFVCGFLWLVVSACILKFVTSGRHGKWEEKHATTNNNNDGDVPAAAVAVELGTDQTAAATATSVPEVLPQAATSAEPAVATAVPLAEPSKADN